MRRNMRMMRRNGRKRRTNEAHEESRGEKRRG